MMYQYGVGMMHGYLQTVLVALGAVGFLALLAVFVPVTRVFNLLTAGALP